jgi:outer membrane protein TolC
MSAAHEPRQEFVNGLELLLREDLRRRSLPARTGRWLPQSRFAAALMIAAVAIVSMVVGGGVVATAYEVRLNEQRDLLLDTFEQRAVVAKQRLALAMQQLRDVQERVSVGIEPQDAVRDIRYRVTEAEAEVKSVELDIAETRATGREPMHALSAPLMAGRDFVTERWRVEMAVPAAALSLEKLRAQAARTRFDVGLGNTMEVDAADTRVIELEAAVEAVERKIGIRQAFLKGRLAAAVAELRGLEAEADLRRSALARRIDLERRQVEDLKARINVGTANPLNLAEAELRLQELQLKMSKAGYDLLLIRKQLGK